MANIQEYELQVQAQQPVAGLSPNLDAVTAVGRSIQNFGEKVGEAQKAQLRRDENVETSDAFAATSDARVEFRDQAQKQIADGSLDVEKFEEQIQQWTDKESEKYQTPAGRNYFQRQSARLRGSLLGTAIRGKALIDGQKSVADFQRGLKNYTNTVQGDPSQFVDSHDAVLEDLTTRKAQGTIPPAMFEKFKASIGTELAQAAIRGYAEQDADNITASIREGQTKVDPAQFAKAEKALESGAFDDYLDSDQKKALKAEIRVLKSAGETEGERALQAQKSAQGLEAEKWKSDAIAKLTQNTLTTKEVLKSPLLAEDKKQWIDMIKAASKEEVKTDPRLKLDIINRMNLPDNDPRKISDPGQLQKFVGKGISPTDYGELNNWFDKTPNGQILQSNRKMLMDMAKGRLVKTNPMLGIQDPDGEYNMMMYTNALMQKEAEYRAANKPISDLYNPNSKEFFGNQLVQYQKSPQEILKAIADRSRGTSAQQPTTVQQAPSLLPPKKETENQPPPPKEVKRKTADGRVAVFDEATKKFVRWDN